MLNVLVQLSQFANYSPQNINLLWLIFGLEDT